MRKTGFGYAAGARRHMKMQRSAGDISVLRRITYAMISIDFEDAGCPNAK